MLPRPRPLDVAVAAMLAALALFFAERAVATVQGVATLPSSWPARGALLGLHEAAVALVLSWIGLVGWLASRARRPWVVLAVAPLLPAGLGTWAGYALASGPWISEQWFSPVAALGPGIAAVLATFVAVRVAWRAGAATSLGLVLLAVGGVVADATLAVGHLPALHLLAYALTASATTLLALRLVATRRAAIPRAAAWALALAAFVGPASWITMGPSTRAELLLRSPLAREVLRATTPAPTTRLFAELRDLDRNAVGVGHTPSVAAIERPLGASVLIVTIDALRADALPPSRTGDREHAQSGDTPNLDAFIGSALAFRHAYAPASFTMRSLPAAFASRPASEDPEALGPALPRAMAAAGRIPLAVADRYFIEEPEGRALLQAFELVEVHAGDDMRMGVDQLLGAIDHADGRPFFAWMHLFATHAPGYAGRPLGRRDGTWPQRYRTSLRWVDREIGRLLAGLQSRGLHEHVIVVLASDHGEGLGDNGVALHGETVFEEEVRVPLAIRIPGQPGAVVDTTVGLVDLPPTLLDLLGEPADPRHEGRSLLPLLADPGALPPRDVLTMSRRDTFALVRGRDKLVYDAGADVMLRFDLRGDPTEDHDVFGHAPEIDHALVSAFVRARPELFAAELQDPRTRALLLEHLRAIDPGEPGAALAFLLRLVALAPDDELVAAATAAFAPGNDETRLAIVESLAAVAPDAVGDAIEAHLSTIEGTADELAFVEALARRRPPPVALPRIGARLTWWAEHGEPRDWAPWAALVRAWPRLEWDDYGPALQAIASRPDAPVEVLRDALAAAEHLVAAQREPMGPFEAIALAHVEHPDTGVRAAACSALISLGTPAALAALGRALARPGEDIRVRQACLKAAAFAGREAAVDLVIEQAADPLLTFYAIRLLEMLRSHAAIPFLEATIAKEKRGRIHAAATLALRRTRAALRDGAEHGLPAARER